MEPFITLNSKVIPLVRNDIDTDQIIPAYYLKVTDKAGLGDGLFAGWRYMPDGSPNPDFPLNKAEYRGAQALLVGENFGCGSSREHAPWALVGWGIRAVFSTSFADIFRSNSLKNGLLPVIVDQALHRAMCELAADHSGLQVIIDLASQTVSLPYGQTVYFPIDPFSKICLLKGVDPLGYLLEQSEVIAGYEQSAATRTLSTLKI